MFKKIILIDKINQRISLYLQVHRYNCIDTTNKGDLIHAGKMSSAWFPQYICTFPLSCTKTNNS